MGIKAFDKELNCEVFAKNAIPKSKGVYCCPEKECISANVPIYLCQKKNGNCFVSYNAAMHKGCDFVSSFDKKYHNIQIPDLSLDKLYNSLNENVVMKNQNKNSKYKEGNFKSKEKEIVVTEINSIYQLYRYFSSNEPTFIFSPGTMIQDVFIDTGTSQKWYADRQTIENKLLLVVGYYFQVFDDDLRIRLRIHNGKYDLKVSIKFDNKSDFDLIKTKFESYNKADVKVALFGIANSHPYSFQKNGKDITYYEITIRYVNNNIHFISRKKQS